ncbi:hypothetical protein Tco_0791078 [Tanacetum coccineum]
MSEAEPIPPTSSVTALRIPMIKKGEYGHVLKMRQLELYDAKVSHEDANLKFLRSLPSVWHVVATMIRGQPGLDELEFDDLYNNLKVYEHELKGVSNLSLQNIAFMSTEIKGSTLKQNKNHMFFLCSTSIYAYNSCDEACCKLMRFAKYQENRANGRKEKKIVAIEDSNSKALVATDNNEEIDWTKEFDAETIDAEPVHFGSDGLGDFDWSNKADDTPVSLALMATNSEWRDLKLEEKQKELDQVLKERDDFKDLGLNLVLLGQEYLMQFFHKYWAIQKRFKDYAYNGTVLLLSMTGDKDKLSDFKEFKGGFVAFGKILKEDEITGKDLLTKGFDLARFNFLVVTIGLKLSILQDESQTSGGDEGLLDLYALNREVRRLKKQNISQPILIHRLKAKLKKLSKGVKPLVKHHILWVKSQKLKKRGKKQKKKVSSVKLGRNKDEGNLSEEHHDQDDHNHTAFKRKSDETEQVIIEEEKDTSDVKSGDTEELDLERIQSTARQSAVTPRTLNFDDEAGPSSPIRPTQEEEPEEQFKDDEFLADISLNISRPRGLSIPGPMQSQPQQPTQTTDPKEKGKGILVEEPKKKKLTLQQIRALETTHDEEVARNGSCNGSR